MLMHKMKFGYLNKLKYFSRINMELESVKSKLYKI